MLLSIKKIIQSHNGLYFTLNGVKYYEFDELVSHIKGKLDKNQMQHINIEWYWDYQGDDIKDTVEGTLAHNYSFEMSLITEDIL